MSKLTLTLGQHAKLKAIQGELEKYAAQLQLLFLEDMQGALADEVFDFAVRVNDEKPVGDARLKALAKLAVDTFGLFTKFDEVVGKAEIEPPKLNDDPPKDEPFKPERPETAAEEIAQACLGITLKSRGRDHLDFHELHVGSVAKALETAYNRGQRQGIKLGRDGIEGMTLDEQRQAAADEAWESADIGDVEDADGWYRDGVYWSRRVYWSDGDGDSIAGSFGVEFRDGTAEIVDTWSQ